jgi:hypothetical protein
MRTILEKCHGRNFSVVDVRDDGMVELDVGAVVGKDWFEETILIKPDCIEVIKVRADE